MTTSIAAFMSRQMQEHPAPEGVSMLVDAIRARFGDAVGAVLMYGSCRRRADAHEGLVDLLVIVTDYRSAYGCGPAAAGNALLPPNVYYLEADDSQERRIRCKYAVVSMRGFRRRCRGGMDGYFWARFSQPVTLVYSADAGMRDRVAHARAEAALAFARRAAPLAGSAATAREFWADALAMSYGCELRPESPEAARALVETEPQYWEELATLLSGAVTPGTAPRSMAQLAWRARALWSRTLNVARLFKAAGTFTDGIDYLLWKIERHTGVRVEATDGMRRRPRLSACRLAWRLWRQGAFR